MRPVVFVKAAPIVFTGIIEETGRIEDVGPEHGARRVTISCSFADELRVDESVAVDGACLTVVHAAAGVFSAVIVEETLARTTLGSLETGDRVNLERAVPIGGRLDGHLVQGHVDAKGVVRRLHQLPGSRVVTIEYPAPFAAYLVEKGSIAVDGISLTLATLDEPAGSFSVAIIPHTLERTNAAHWQEGEPVNLEFDLVGKYVVRGRRMGDSASGSTEGTPDARSVGHEGG